MSSLLRRIIGNCIFFERFIICQAVHILVHQVVQVQLVQVAILGVEVAQVVLHLLLGYYLLQIESLILVLGIWEKKAI